MTVEKGFKAIEKVVKAPGKGLKKLFKKKEKTSKSDLETPSPPPYNSLPTAPEILEVLIPVALLIGIIVFFVVFRGDINR